MFLKGRRFVMGGPIDMNVGVFWDTSVGVLKTVNSIRAFLNDLGQISEVCSFEDIGQSRFHAKLFKCT